jgi:hypothetical protein
MYVKGREVGEDMVLLCCWPVGYAQTVGHRIRGISARLESRSYFERSSFLYLHSPLRFSDAQSMHA